MAERVRFELTSPVKDLRFSSLATRTYALRIRAQTPDQWVYPEETFCRNWRRFKVECNLSAT